MQPSHCIPNFLSHLYTFVFESPQIYGQSGGFMWSIIQVTHWGVIEREALKVQAMQT